MTRAVRREVIEYQPSAKDGARVFVRCPCGSHFERGPLDPAAPRRCAWCYRSTADAVPVERP